MRNIMVNIDNSFFFSWHPVTEMNLDGLRAFVDQYANTGVSDLQFCTNSQRSSVQCTSRQTVWDGYDPEANDDQPFFSGIADEDVLPGGPNARRHMRNWVHACWLLHANGIDPYEIWIERSRFHGIHPWLSMRMNDRHFVNQPNHCIHDRFWKEHREFRRDPDMDPGNGQCFDYGYRKVRAYQLSYAKEMISRYDIDGYELDWMRNPAYFTPGKAAEGAALLTEFVSQIRYLLDKRAAELGHKIRLGVRVPPHPETAMQLGFDVIAWARQGLVDTFVISSFLKHEFDVPVEVWLAMLDGTGATLSGGLMSQIRIGDMATSHTLESARGAAVNLLSRGADSISLYNFFDNRPYGSFGESYRRSTIAESYRRAMNELGDIKGLLQLSRRHVVTPSDVSVPGQRLEAPLPSEVAVDRHAELCIYTGPLPGSGQRARVILKLEGKAEPLSDLWVTVNNDLCRHIGELEFLADGKTPAVAFEIHSGVLRRDYNLVRVRSNADVHCRLTGLEIRISDHRGCFPTGAVETAAMFPIH